MEWDKYYRERIHWISLWPDFDAIKVNTSFYFFK